ncbi:MAG: phytanoyl-CoA dioxygenase family protein, partial [Gammaproteobacteria bacterium]|nr:phytanoyl-CoA dioxygenase family protein [Gammaproteobacteria bacterium]
MQFGEFENTKEFNATFKRIGELGLERNIFELDSYGFTVVPPDKVAEREFFERIRATVLRICKDRTGVDFALESNGEFGHYKAQPQSDGQFLLFYLLMADRVFEEWIVNPTLYTLINYLMRGQQQLSSLTSFVKWKGERDTLGLHSDSPPDRDGRMPPCSDVANAAYCLTDYTLDNGAIAMVPGSHTFCRQPKPGEGEDMAVPVEAEAGSLIVWHGNTWHGAFEKKTDGLRLNV